ncbi:MAG: hypothetical protein ABI178_15310 [Rhodanobacter sp.]
MFLRTIGSAPDKEHLMLQFIPFEDDWDALERLRPEDLIPYRIGLLPEPAVAVPASELAPAPVCRSSVPNGHRPDPAC